MAADRSIPLTDEAATAALARRLAGIVQPGDVIALEGDLGVGKTAFARAFIRTWAGAAEDVPSPTFTLVQCYDCDLGTIWHFDLYRLERPDDALELGIEDAFADGVSLIEWPDRLGPWLPAGRLVLRLEPGPRDGSRRAVLSGGPDWQRRLVEIIGE